MEYDSVIKMSELLTYIITWLNLKHTLTERRQTQDVYCMRPFL